MKLKQVIIFSMIIVLLSGCIDYSKLTSGEKFKVFKVFLSYQAGYTYKVLYYDNDNRIESFDISEHNVDLYNSNKSLLIYIGNERWRLYINSSVPIEGLKSSYMVGKIITTSDVKEIPIEEP